MKRSSMMVDVPREHYDLAMSHIEHLTDCVEAAPYVYQVIDCRMPDPMPVGWIQLDLGGEGLTPLLYTVHAQCRSCGASTVLEVRDPEPVDLDERWKQMTDPVNRVLQVCARIETGEDEPEDTEIVARFAREVLRLRAQMDKLECTKGVARDIGHCAVRAVVT